MVARQLLARLLNCGRNGFAVSVSIKQPHLNVHYVSEFKALFYAGVTSDEALFAVCNDELDATLKQVINSEFSAGKSL